jgi:hypothetical protein
LRACLPACKIAKLAFLSDLRRQPWHHLRICASICPAGRDSVVRSLPPSHPFSRSSFICLGFDETVELQLFDRSRLVSIDHLNCFRVQFSRSNKIVVMMMQHETA